VIVNNAGTIVAYNDYYPFGMLMEGRSYVNGATDASYKFTGKERDVETNYDYFGARYYDARIGRWLSKDPLAEKYPSLSPYTYCANNPMLFVDPDGKELTRVTQGNMTVVCDKKIVTNVRNFLKGIQINKLPVTINNSFRTTAEQTWLFNHKDSNPNPVADPGTSRHESGFAIDFKHVDDLTESQRETLNKIAKENKFSPLENDMPHFESDPMDFGYKNRLAAIAENQKDFEKSDSPSWTSTNNNSNSGSLWNSWKQSLGIQSIEDQIMKIMGK
jgi:RHS repeat-associated protein